MSKRNKIRAALGSVLVFAIIVTCAAVYQTGSKSTPNEKELVKNEENIADEAIKTEEKPEEEAEDVNTSDVEGTRETEDTEELQGENTEEQIANTEENAGETVAEETVTEEIVQPESEVQDTAAPVETAAAPDINFTESSLMEWPVNGQVVIDYNMDNTIYFPTLNEYKYSPAIAISSDVDTPVAAVANGKVVSVAESEETGTTMTVDMGNGYQAVYGQLKDVAFQADDYVEAGNIIGYVNEPTKYYVKEGANLYFALAKDGTSLDPLQYLP